MIFRFTANKIGLCWFYSSGISYYINRTCFILFFTDWKIWNFEGV